MNDDLAGEFLLHPADGLVGAVRVSDETLVTFDAAGNVVWWFEDSPVVVHAVRVQRPLSLFAADGDAVVFADGAGRLQELENRGAGTAVAHSVGTGPFDLIAASPAGDVVALADSGGDGVRVFFVASEQVRDYAPQIEHPACLGVSLDGRIVGCGAADGRVWAVPLEAGSARLVADAVHDAGRPTHIEGRPGGGWVVAYENGLVAAVGWDGGLEGESAADGCIVTCLAVDPLRGHIAVGVDDGTVRVLHPDLDRTAFSVRAQAERVQRAWFWGSDLETLGAGGEIRRIRI